MIVEGFLALSLILNLFLVWYTRNTLSNLLYLSENLGVLYDDVASFSLHLKKVYELEKFYGDPTLTHLLEHSNALRDELEGYEEIFMLSGSPVDDGEESIDGEEEA